MTRSLISYPDQWDAVQLCSAAQSQIWDEVLAVVCPDLDSRYDVIPDRFTNQVFANPGYQLLDRVQDRIRQTLRAL